MNAFFRSVSIACALTLFATVAHATPVVYTESGIFSGTLGTTTFTNVAGTFKFTGNTSNVVQALPGFYTNTLGVSTFSLSGFSTATFTSSTFGAESQPNAGAFYDVNTNFGIGTLSTAFAGYALTSPFGPITGSFITNGPIAEATTLGNLIITGETGNTTFTATSAVTTTPEPSSFILLATGLATSARFVRRKLQKA